MFSLGYAYAVNTYSNAITAVYRLDNNIFITKPLKTFKEPQNYYFPQSTRTFVVSKKKNVNMQLHLRINYLPVKMYIIEAWYIIIFI